MTRNKLHFILKFCIRYQSCYTTSLFTLLVLHLADECAKWIAVFALKVEHTKENRQLFSFSISNTFSNTMYFCICICVHYFLLQGIFRGILFLGPIAVKINTRVCDKRNTREINTFIFGTLCEIRGPYEEQISAKWHISSLTLSHMNV